MRTLSVFNQVSVDGYFASVTGDMGWMRQGDNDPELKDFVDGNASRASVLVFGRRTYEMMASFWPTPAAAAQSPALAARMNALPKIVFSRTLARAPWSGTTLLPGDPLEEIRRLKREPGDPLVILGSGGLVGPLVAAGLVDEVQLLVAPVVLGAGRSMFAGVEAPVGLRLESTRTFPSGKVFLVYSRARAA
jgi:dihydrofolate reductase